MSTMTSVLARSPISPDRTSGRQQHQDHEVAELIQHAPLGRARRRFGQPIQAVPLLAFSDLVGRQAGIEAHSEVPCQIGAVVQVGLGQRLLLLIRPHASPRFERPRQQLEGKSRRWFLKANWTQDCTEALRIKEISAALV
jgi:hypothetical protein